MPSRLWFKRKRYGWGWTPVTWQGWLSVLAYVVTLTLLSLRINVRSSVPDVVFTFVLPSILLTFFLIRLCYKKGERPRWQWGEESL